MLFDDIPSQPVCCAVKTLLMDAHLVCTRYQFKFAICQSTMLPKSDQEDMFMILFYLFQSVALSVLSCFVTDEVGEYLTKLYLSDILLFSEAKVPLFLERGRGGGGGKMSVRVKSCNGVTVISKVSNQR